MKRVHVHIHVQSLEPSIAFYTRLFGQSPDLLREDYAHWSIAEPPLNLAISDSGSRTGVSHLGIETGDKAELGGLWEQVAEDVTLDEGRTRCCYALSDKRWAEDPDGVAWELFHTERRLAERSAQEQASPVTSSSRCCSPAANNEEAR